MNKLIQNLKSGGISHDFKQPRHFTFSFDSQ